VTAWRACTGAGCWQELWPHAEREAHTGAGLLAGLTPWGTHGGAVHEELQLLGRTHV